jgi:hypothetical protein
MTIVKMIIAGLTLLFGIWAAFAPEQVMALVGMAATGPRGISEARVALGAIYIGLGMYCLWTRSPSAFSTLGAAIVLRDGVGATDIGSRGQRCGGHQQLGQHGGGSAVRSGVAGAAFNLCAPAARRLNSNCAIFRQGFR